MYRLALGSTRAIRPAARYPRGRLYRHIEACRNGSAALSDCKHSPLSVSSGRGYSTVGHEPFLNGSSSSYIEAMYESWQADRTSVHKVRGGSVYKVRGGFVHKKWPCKVRGCSAHMVRGCPECKVRVGLNIELVVYLNIR